MKREEIMTIRRKKILFSVSIDASKLKQKKSKNLFQLTKSIQIYVAGK